MAEQKPIRRLGSATQQEIARRAGVSRSTVAGILGGTISERYNEETRQRVLKVARDLEYKPNRWALNLKRGRSGVIGLLYFGGFSEQTLEKLYLAIQLIQRQGYQVLIQDILWSEDGGKLATEVFADHQVEGLLIIGWSHFFESKHLNRLIDSGMPAVGISISQLFPIPQTGPKKKEGFVSLGHYLYNEGHRHFVLVTRHLTYHGQQSERSHQQSLLEGIKEVMRQHPEIKMEHLQSRHDTKRAQHSNYVEDAANLVTEYLRQNKGNLPDVFVCHDDAWALGVQNTLIRMGYRIPQDVAVTGCNDSNIACALVSPLTTIREPIQNMVSRAVEMLIGYITTPETFQSEEIAELFESQLVVRESSQRS